MSINFFLDKYWKKKTVLGEWHFFALPRSESTLRAWFASTHCCTISYLVSSCRLRWMTPIFGSFRHQVSIPQSLDMKLYLLELSNSNLGKEFGRVGHLASANSSCGRWHTKNVGQLIALQEKDFHTRQFVPSATRLRKRWITCWSPAPSPGRCGSICYKALDCRHLPQG